MFVFITTRPRRWMKAFGKQLVTDPDVVVISIRDPGTPEILPDGPRVLNLEFYDGTPEDPDTEDLALFSEDQARKVVEFLYPFAQSEHEYSLVAQCHAGISRSGAIAVFAQRLTQMSWNDFVENNRSIDPNDYVLRLLMREYYVPEFE